MFTDRVARPSLRAAWPRWGVATALGVVVVSAIALFGMGRSLWCRCGTASPWSWDIWSEHNSQHLLDPYTFTHVQHSVLFCGLPWLAFRSRRPAVRALLAVIVEATWEVAENTDAVIESYRESTISLNYYGDSILNSVADTAAFVVGYIAALRLPVWICAVRFIGVEVVLVSTIRDSLLLNVLMLVHPVEAIKIWQTGGSERDPRPWARAPYKGIRRIPQLGAIGEHGESASLVV